MAEQSKKPWWRPFVSPRFGMPPLAVAVVALIGLVYQSGGWAAGWLEWVVGPALVWTVVTLYQDLRQTYRESLMWVYLLKAATLGAAVMVIVIIYASLVGLYYLAAALMLMAVPFLSLHAVRISKRFRVKKNKEVARPETVVAIKQEKNKPETEEDDSYVIVFRDSEYAFPKSQVHYWGLVGGLSLLIFAVVPGILKLACLVVLWGAVYFQRRGAFDQVAKKDPPQTDAPPPETRQPQQSVYRRPSSGQSSSSRHRRPPPNHRSGGSRKSDPEIRV